MATEVLHISVTDDGSARVVARNLENLGKSGKKAETTVDALRKAMSKAAKATLVFGTAATALAAGGLAAIISNGNESATALAKFNAILRASGTEGERTGATLVREARNIAKATGVAFEDVANTSAQLLTFYSIPEELRATALKLSIDAGTIFGSSASAAQQLGKALENPISGLGALSESGIKFSAEQKRSIQILVETGRLYEAQKIILDEYASAVEGAAEEVGKTLPGSLNILRETLKDAMADLDEKSGLSAELAKATKKLSDFLASAEGKRTIDDLAGAVKVLAENLLLVAEYAGKAAAALPGVVQQTAFRFGGDPDVLGLGGVSRAEIEKRLSSLREMKRILETPASELGLFDRARRALIPDDETFSPERILADIAKLEAELGRRFLANAKPPAGFVPPAPAPAPPKPERPTNFNIDGQLTLKEQEKAAKARQKAIADFQRLRGELDPIVEAGNRYAESLRIINAAAETGAFSQEQIAQAVAGVTKEFEKARDAASAEAVEEFRRLQESLDPAIAAGREYARTLQIIDAAARTGKVSQEEIAAAVQGATDAYNKAREGLGVQGDILGAVAGQFDNALNSLVNFANTGKASISEFAASVVSDLQRVFLKLLLVKSLEGLAGAFGGASGGGFGGIVGSLATLIGGTRAEGGPVSPGKVFLVGEKGPELFVPPTRGNILANDALENGASAARTPVNVNLDLDPMRMVDVLQTREAEDVILRVMQKNRGKLREVF